MSFERGTPPRNSEPSRLSSGPPSYLHPEPRHGISNQNSKSDTQHPNHKPQTLQAWRPSRASQPRAMTSGATTCGDRASGYIPNPWGKTLGKASAVMSTLNALLNALHPSNLQTENPKPSTQNFEALGQASLNSCTPPRIPHRPRINPLEPSLKPLQTL